MNYLSIIVAVVLGVFGGFGIENYKAHVNRTNFVNFLHAENCESLGPASDNPSPVTGQPWSKYFGEGFICSAGGGQNLIVAIPK